MAEDRIIDDNAGSTETGLGNVLKRFLSEEVFHDVILKGNDGVEIGANRCTLGARSKVLERMLLGSFSEANKKIIEIRSYEGDILKAVVEYAHTDNPEILNSHTPKRRKAGKESVFAETNKIETLITLAGAAMYFDLPGLIHAVKQYLSQAMDRSPFLAFLLLDICRQKGSSVPPELSERSWLRSPARLKQVIRDLEAKALASDRAEVMLAVLAPISQETLGEILKDDETNLDDFQRFLLLLKWTEASDNPTERKEIAKGLVRNICLEKLDTPQLTRVKRSGLVPMEKLLELFEAHALAANINAQLTSSLSANSLPVWSNTKLHSSMTATKHKNYANYPGLLKCPAISSGLHQWILQQVGENVHDLAFGVALANKGARGKGKWLFLQKGAWGFDGQGRAYCDGKEDEEGASTNNCLNDGGQVILTLDLLNGNRTLSASIILKDGGTKTFQSIKLPTHLVRLRQNNSLTTCTFVPAVETCHRSGFRLLSYRKLQD